MAKQNNLGFDEVLFGREGTLKHLAQRTTQFGFTIVTGRPQMGKSSTLEALCKRQAEQGLIIGFHEAKGGESSHLLYAVADLYTQWLSNSSWREQAIRLWDKHKSGLVPRVGQMVGKLFEQFAGVAGVPENIAHIVSQGFDSLAFAQQDLQNPPIQLAPLPYDQALSLIQLVYKLTGQRIVLVLDAWEKSSSIQAEYQTLETILAHEEDWDSTHIILAIRDPEIGYVSDKQALNDAQYLKKQSPCVEHFSLPPMELSSLDEQARLIQHLHTAVPNSKTIADEKLFELINGYPGVIAFWSKKYVQGNLTSLDDFARLANDAQQLRYSELDQLLPILQGEPKEFIQCLAFLPRLDANSWQVLKTVLLTNPNTVSIEQLIDHDILAGEDFPSLGHDTRHTAVYQWFVQKEPNTYRKVCDQLIESLAMQISGAEHPNLIYILALAGSVGKVNINNLSEQSIQLTTVAQRLVEGKEILLGKEFDLFYPHAINQNKKLTPLISVALNYRGFRKSEEGDIEGAIKDYNSVVELKGAPVGQIAQALNNRGAGKGKQEDNKGAIKDYTLVIELAGVSKAQAAHALCNRGASKAKQGDIKDAIEDYNKVIDLAGVPEEELGQALFNRAVCMGKQGKVGSCIQDYTAIIKLKDLPMKLLAQTLVNRGIILAKNDDVDGAVKDFSTVIGFDNVPVESLAKAFCNRGVCKEKQEGDGVIEDYTAVVDLNGAPIKDLALALVNRGRFIFFHHGNVEGAVKDFKAVILLPDVPVKLFAEALYCLAVFKTEQGDIAGGIQDFTGVIELVDAPVVELAKALCNRALLISQQGDIEGAIEDCTAILGLMGAASEEVAHAFVTRGAMKAQQGNFEAAIKDFIAVLELVDAPKDLKAIAQKNLKRIGYSDN